MDEQVVLHIIIDTYILHTRICITYTDSFILSLDFDSYYLEPRGPNDLDSVLVDWKLIFDSIVLVELMMN